ncbi:hypothetical protein OG948_20190 [Embleya sp. NBC_00888]|uniref:hypothetical protein n=1 Tax=Embleya sp. NBC_00888 TaxID=2975960 RepID=UPI0038648A05|nr:hypothetical protein OG948_20190 [Embleya sp. NBC_00888]
MGSPGQPPEPRLPTPGRAPSRGVPDGLLIAGLLLLIAGTAVIWLSTGLAALASGKDWPDGVTYRRSALAMRSVFGTPDDLPRAWPDTPPGQLPTPTAFWVSFGFVVLLLLIAAGCVFRWWLRRMAARAARAPAAAAVPNAPAQSPNSLAPNRNQRLPDGE